MNPNPFHALIDVRKINRSLAKQNGKDWHDDELLLTKHCSLSHNDSQLLEIELKHLFFVLKHSDNYSSEIYATIKSIHECSSPVAIPEWYQPHREKQGKLSAERRRRCTSRQGYEWTIETILKAIKRTHGLLKHTHFIFTV